MTEKGSRLGRYRLEELLGQGGMAEVWRATDERLGRTVAVKAILAAHAREGNFRERFRTEARLVASLDHPSILPVYDYGDEGGVPYLVMPYLEGGTLRDRMLGSPVPFAQAVSWIRQLGDALDAAHASGILHRDVKPANVLIRRDGRLALADFGIAKMLEASTGLTVTGMVVGTPVYMAPEQAQGKPATPASDRYALAVLAYELLSGKPPFGGESALALLHQHVTSPAPRLSSAVFGLPAGLDPVFEAALAKEPERRPPAGRAFADQLVAFVPTGTGLDLDGSTEPWAPADRTSPTVFEAMPRWPASGRHVRGSDLTSQATISTTPQPSRRTLIAAGTGAAAVLALAVAGLLNSRSPSAPVPAPPRVAGPGGEPATATPVVQKTAKGGRAASSVPTAPREPAVVSKGDPAVREATGASESDRPVPVPSPPGATEAEAGSGPPPDLREALARLDPVARGGSRPTREDFEAVAREANAILARDPGRPGSRAIESYALGGVAYIDGRDGEALRLLLVAQAQGGRVGPWDVRVLRSAFARVQGNDGTVGWELALAYGDVRREAEALLAKDLARDPADPRALLGRAVLRRMERRSAEAIADATAVFERRPAGSLRAAAAELVADEHVSAKAWEDAAHWYRKAAIPQGPASAHAGWEGARILDEKLGRPDEARELYAVACRAGNRKACLATGEPAPRPKRFPRRRGP